MQNNKNTKTQKSHKYTVYSYVNEILTLK